MASGTAVLASRRLHADPNPTLREGEALEIEKFTIIKILEIAFPGERGQKAAV